MFGSVLMEHKTTLLRAVKRNAEVLHHVREGQNVGNPVGVVPHYTGVPYECADQACLGYSCVASDGDLSTAFSDVG